MPRGKVKRGWPPQHLVKIPRRPCRGPARGHTMTHRRPRPARPGAAVAAQRDDCTDGALTSVASQFVTDGDIVYTRWDTRDLTGAPLRRSNHTVSVNV